jgi:hypothetical protein
MFKGAGSGFKGLGSPASAEKGALARFPSLRRHDPDQVQRVTALAIL